MSRCQNAYNTEVHELIVGVHKLAAGLTASTPCSTSDWRDASKSSTSPAHYEPAHYEPAHYKPAHYTPAHYEPAHYTPAHYKPAPTRLRITSLRTTSCALQATHYKPAHFKLRATRCKPHVACALKAGACPLKEGSAGAL